MITEGKYQGIIVQSQFGETKNGNAQLVLTFQLQGKRDPWNDDAALALCETVDRTIYMVFTEKTIEWRTKDLANLGYRHSSFRHLDSNDENPHDFHGLEIPVRCEHDDSYDGRTREKWNLDFGGGVEVKPLDAKGIRQLDALYGKELTKAVSSSVSVDSKTPESEQPEKSTVPPIDDIPF